MTSLDGESDLEFLEETDVFVFEGLWDVSLGKQGTHISNSCVCVKKCVTSILQGRYWW